MNKTIIKLLCGGIVLAASQYGYAGTITVTEYLNITKADGFDNGSATGWNGKAEDNEVEPPSSIGQIWDLEAVVKRQDKTYDPGNPLVKPTYANQKLALVAGFNFATGEGGFKSGDVFIDISDPSNITTSGVVGSNNPYNPGSDRDGWDFAIRFNWGANTYSVYDLAAVYGVVGNANFKYIAPLYSANSPSQPWKVADSTLSAPGVTTYRTGSFTYTSGVNDATIATLFNGQAAVTGGSHYIVDGIDISWLAAFAPANPLTPDANNFKFTYGCGNDMILGESTGGFRKAPDGGFTLCLLGIGLTTMGLLRRKYSATPE